VSTAVLNQADTNPLDYQNAQPGNSGAFTYRGTVWPTNLIQWEIVVDLGGTYNASPFSSSPAAPGAYLPSVYTVVPTCNVYWPYSANASASVTTPSNVGSGSVDAMVDTVASIQVGSFIDSFNVNLTFRAQGTLGFSLLSAG